MRDRRGIDSIFADKKKGQATFLSAPYWGTVSGTIRRRVAGRLLTHSPLPSRSDRPNGPRKSTMALFLRPHVDDAIVKGLWQDDVPRRQQRGYPFILLS